MYTHPPAVPQTYVTPAAQMSAPATQQMQPAAQKYVQSKKEGGGACTGCTSAPSVVYLQAQTLALTQPRLWKVSQGQQTRQALGLSVEPQTPQVQKALEVGLPTQVQKVKEKPSPCFVLLVLAPPLHAGVTARVTGRAVRRIVRSTTRAWATSRVSSTWHLMVSPNRIYRTKTYSQFACTQAPPSGVTWRAQVTLRPVTKWYRSRHTPCRPPA